MRVECATEELLEIKGDAILVFTFEEPSAMEHSLDEKYHQVFSTARKRKEFEGKPKQLVVHRNGQHHGQRFIVLVGLGKKSQVKPETMRNSAAAASVAVKNLGAKHLAIEVPHLDTVNHQLCSQAITEGALLATYQYNKYKTQKLDEIKELSDVTLVTSKELSEKIRQGLEKGKIIADSVNLVRDLQNAPSADMTPAIMAKIAEKTAKDCKFGVTVLDKKKLEKFGYGGILGVGKGSVQESRLVTLEYKHKQAKRTIAIVGKGVCFDSGGISIKPGSKMDEMKFDMSGAANVIGIMRAASMLKLQVNVVGVLGLVENMPSGSAYKPGDIIKTRSGKTIEILNTDAEGRVVLADCLHHATLYKPDAIIDMATLTGACVVALGTLPAGLMGNNDDLLDAIKQASDMTGERVWQLPLWDEYADDIKSQIADMKNLGYPGEAGAISAAMLLKEFVAEKPWVHLDIAGTAWAQGRERYFTSYGGTGYGVRLLVNYLEQL